jgi:hypothetical protein
MRRILEMLEFFVESVSREGELGIKKKELRRKKNRSKK